MDTTLPDLTVTAPLLPSGAAASTAAAACSRLRATASAAGWPLRDASGCDLLAATAAYELHTLRWPKVGLSLGLRDTTAADTPFGRGTASLHRILQRACGTPLPAGLPTVAAGPADELPAFERFALDTVATFVVSQLPHGSGAAVQAVLARLRADLDLTDARTLGLYHAFCARLGHPAAS